MMQTKRFYGVDSMPESYSPLFEQGGKRSFFLTRPWFSNFEKTIVSQDDRVLIYGVEQANCNTQPVAVLPLKISAKGKGLFPPKILSALSNYYSCYFEPIIATSADNVSDIYACLSASLKEDGKLWDVLDISPVPADSPLLAGLIQSLSNQGIPVHRYFCFGNWYLDVGGRSFDEYFKTLPNSLRKNIPYLTRKIERSHTLRIDVHTDAEDLDAALAVYDKLYLTRWERSEPFADFIPGLVAVAAAKGALLLGLLYIDNEPAAAQLWLVDEGIASIYKTAFDRRFSSLSVGSILTARLMQQVIDLDKVREVDYLSGDDAYKREWMSARRERWGIMAFNPASVLGLLLAIRHIGWARVKALLKGTLLPYAATHIEWLKRLLKA